MQAQPATERRAPVIANIACVMEVDSAIPAPTDDAAATEGAEPAPAAAPSVQHVTFNRGDLVWAKHFGFPWWPARVCGCLGKPWVEWEGKYPVRFCHSAERLFMAPDKLLPFASRPDLEDASKIGGLQKKPALRVKFEAAVKEAHEDPTAGTADDYPDPPQPAETLEGWLTSGHFYIGERVARRYFEGKANEHIVVGTISKWLPAAVDEQTGETDAPLFHVSHDDGDEEDLEEYEVAEAMALYTTTPEAMKKAAAKEKAEAKAAKEAERETKAAERAVQAAQKEQERLLKEQERVQKESSKFVRTEFTVVAESS